MSIKSFVVIFFLSFITTYVVSILNDAVNGSLVSGRGGIPFSFVSGTSTNGLMLAIDIAFWFVVIFIFWKSLLKLRKK